MAFRQPCQGSLTDMLDIGEAQPSVGGKVSCAVEADRCPRKPRAGPVIAFQADQPRVDAADRGIELGDAVPAAGQQ
jgi:hypothetical protein